MTLLRRAASDCRTKADAEALRELTERQHGVVSRRQLVDCGLSGTMIARWVGTSRLHRIHPASTRRAIPRFRSRAASSPPSCTAAIHAVLGHTTAAYAWSLIDTEPTRIHITVPYLKILEPRDVRAMLGKGRRGSRALRNALDSHLPQLAETLSVLEQRFLGLSESAGITPPEVNVRVGGMRVDALWREQGLVVELDGAAAHGSWSQVSRDRERELVLRRRGFRVHQVHLAPDHRTAGRCDRRPPSPTGRVCRVIPFRVP